MANNYSPLGFWRSWHRSFNLWIVRYLYIPLGGTHRLVATSVLIFTFVALWHDLSPRLLAWGWLVVLFILPEIMARKVLPPSTVRAPLFPLRPRVLFLFNSSFLFFCAQFGERWWYRHLCAFGGVFNILLMMGANLVGFVVGMDGAQYLASQLVSSWNGEFLLPDIPSCPSLKIDVHAQAFVSFASHVPVCSLAYSSCSNTGRFFRSCTCIIANFL